METCRAAGVILCEIVSEPRFIIRFQPSLAFLYFSGGVGRVNVRTFPDGCHPGSFHSASSALSRGVSLSFAIALQFGFYISVQQRDYLLAACHIISTQPFDKALETERMSASPTSVSIFLMARLFWLWCPIRPCWRIFPLRSPVDGIVQFGKLEIQVLELFFPCHGDGYLVPFPIAFTGPPGDSLTFYPHTLRAISACVSSSLR